LGSQYKFRIDDDSKLSDISETRQQIWKLEAKTPREASKALYEQRWDNERRIIKNIPTHTGQERSSVLDYPCASVNAKE